MRSVTEGPFRGKDELVGRVRSTVDRIELILMTFLVVSNGCCFFYFLLLLLL